MNKLVLGFLGLFLLSSCTEQIRARNFGGSTTVDLACGNKVVNATWKNVDLWVLTKPMKAADTPEEYSFSEHSAWGVIQGTVVIKESRCEINLGKL